MKTALIIEDNLEIRENTSEMLELAGYKVITALNGKEGILAANRELPNVILCDIMMPEMDGYGVIKEVKENPLTAKIPFVYVTASAEKSEMQMGLDIGADAYVTKPFDVSELMEAICTAMEK